MDNRRHQVLLMSLFFSMLIGCSDKQLGKHAFEVYSDGDIPVAANTGGPKYGEDLFKFEKVVTLQEDPGRPDSYLYQSISFIRTVKGFFLGDDGRYYVGDSGGARIAVYDASGRYERSIGRQGEGPGEFVLCELYELADGVLKILDYNLHRTTCYGTDGTLIEMIRGGGFHFPERDMVVNLTMPSYYDENGYLWMGAGFTAFDSGGDTLGTASTRQIQILYAFATPGHGKGGQSRPPVPFIDRPFTKCLPDGSVLMTDGIEPVLWWYRPDGSVRRIIDLGIPPRALNREEITRFYRDLDSQIAAADDNTKVYLGWMRNAVVFPEYRTLWNHISVDDKGYMWLEAYEMYFERNDRGGGCTYYLLSPEGEYLGTTRAPAVGRVAKGRFMGEVTDPETHRVEYSVWRLLPQPEGFVYP